MGSLGPQVQVERVRTGPPDQSTQAGITLEAVRERVLAAVTISLQKPARTDLIARIKVNHP